MKKIFLLLAVFLISIPSFAAKTQKIKLAILAPEGTTWMNTMHEFNRELKAKSNGELQFKIYSGGVAGDELDVIRKMRAGQMHAGGFTGVGLGKILSEVRVLELPFIFKNAKEVDHVTSSLMSYFEERFDKKGYVFLGFAEAGFVNVFSTKPLRGQADLKTAKMWAWEGDPLVKALSKTYGIVPVSLSITDVLTSLQTGLIDSFYAPPLAAIALQWFTKVKYMMRPELSNATGAMVLTKKMFNKIPEKNQKILMDVSRKYSRLIIDRTRKDNLESYNVLKKHGIQFIQMPAKEVRLVKETSKKVQAALAGKLYSKALLQRVLKLINDYRNKRKNSTKVES